MIAGSSTCFSQGASQAQAEHESTRQKALFYQKGNTAAAVLWTVDNLAASAFVDLCSCVLLLCGQV